MSNTNLDSYDGSFGDISTPMHQPDAPQHLEWASPTSTDLPEVHRGGAKFVSSASEFALADLQASTSKADPARELAALQARMSVLQAEIAASKPPTQVQTPPPRKRTASRGGYNATPPSKRACPATPTPKRTTQGATVRGPIEAMWSPGVTADQRRAMYDSGIGLTPGHIMVSSPAASNKTSPPPKRKAAPKKPRAPAQKRKQAPKKVPKKQQASFNFDGVDLTTIDASAFTNPDESVQNKRPVSELYDENFMSLPLSDKARLLLPLLRGIDPATGQKFAVPGALGRTAVPEPQGDALEAAAIGSLMSYVSANDTATSPDAGSSPGILNQTATSPASSAPATDVANKDDTYISPDFFDEFHAENTAGDDSLAAIGDLFDDFINIPPTNSNTQSTACDAVVGPTSPMNFAEYLESLPSIDSTEDTQPQVDNSQIAVTGTAFDEFLATQPFDDNLLLDINSFPSDPSWWFQTDSPTDGSFTIIPFPEELTTTTATTTTSTTTTSDLDAGMQIALNGAATIGSPESGAKRQRKALEEHERRVAEDIVTTNIPGLLTQTTPFRTITIKELHPTFGAEIQDVDFQNLSDEQFREIKAAMAKYGFLVFRNTGLSDAQHVDFSARIGELNNVRRYLTGGRKLRYTHYELFDAGNVDEEGNPIAPDSPRAHYNKGNALFHVDSSFNPRRASWSLLRAIKLPPPGHGGETEFADSRTAWDGLDEGLKKELLERDLVGAHTLLHSRKLGSPEFFKDLVPESEPMMRHKIVQTHEPSGRTNLYLSTHCHHLETKDCEPLEEGESEVLFKRLLDHVTQPKYVMSMEWLNVGDMVAWDNTGVMHRATGGSFEGKFVRDVRRTTVHDDSSTAWGLNAGQEARGFNLQKAMGDGKGTAPPPVSAAQIEV